MALLPYVDESKASPKTLEILGNTPRKLNVARMIANASDAVFQNFSRLGNSLMTRGKLDGKLREIAILRNARVCNSLYEYTQHVPIAKSVGVTDEQLAGIDNWPNATCFSEVERLVLEFTDTIARNVKGGKATLQALQKHLGPGEIVELIMAVGFWGMVARVLETTEVDLEDFAGKVNILERAGR
ncbi:MAG TPA: carboxymuconolactone decarboxylase family protein [Candidatus Binataceae bacterium]|jgi:alkylhydroperoxidase family enzyme|nr:carboxymuconolactone decarboxylase family protein [Candidatus Binataceae bacterium]